MTPHPIIEKYELEIWDSWCSLGEQIGKDMARTPVTKDQDSLIRQYPDLRWAFSLGVRAGQFRDSV